MTVVRCSVYPKSPITLRSQSSQTISRAEERERREMALLLSSVASAIYSFPSTSIGSITNGLPFSSPPCASKHFSAARLEKKKFSLRSGSASAIVLPTHSSVLGRREVMVWAASDAADSLDLPSEGSGQPVPVENLPLESKLQERLEQKLKMKLAKKIRLRRKRLLRKRHLRKKGRWPPSKMKKNKNV